MKSLNYFLCSFLIFTTNAYSQVAEQNENIIATTKGKTKGIQVEFKGVKGFSGSGGQSDSNYEVSLGYVVAQSWQIQLTLGRLSKSKFQSGGDLKEWEYVEESTKLNSEYKMLEIKKYFFDPYSERHIQGFFASTGYGVQDGQINYDYNRYKPYNGFICLIGTCEKAVEESDSGSTKASIPFARVGGGYSYEMKSPRSLGVVTLSGSVYYNEYFKKDIVALSGANHQSSFDLKSLDKTTAQLALGVMF